MMNDDMALVREYASRQSEQAFDMLVSRHVNLVHSAALRQVRDPSAAQEITQTVFIILARKAGSLSPNTILPGWLYRTTRYVTAASMKAQRRRERREQEAQVSLDTPESQAGPDWEQFSPLLDEAMAQLRDSDRDALVLRYFQNRSLRDVGAAFGLNELAAQKRVSRALDKLRKFFLKRGVVSTTAVLAGAISANSVQAAPATLSQSIAALAVSEGAAASSSTLTLIQGAMKLMAWTNAKTAMVASASVLLVAGTATITVKQVAAHKTEALWRVQNPDPDRAPQLVDILPTKFSGADNALNVGSRGDNWIGINRPPLEIARVAYAWRPGRIVFEGKRPTNPACYDFISTLPEGSGAALQALLKKELGLVGRIEPREMEVLVLKVRRPNATGLKPPGAGHADFINTGRYHCDNSPISSNNGWFPGITRFLESYFGVPVLDQTGLTQNFQIDLRWDERGDADPGHQALHQALLDQLGFVLEPRREQVEMLVMSEAR